MRGIIAGVTGVLIAQAGHEPSAMAAILLIWPRVWASVIAMAVRFVLVSLAGAPHSPAAAAALLIPLGGFSVAGKSLLVLTCGALLVVALSEAARRLRARRLNLS